MIIWSFLDPPPPYVMPLCPRPYAFLSHFALPPSPSLRDVIHEWSLDNLQLYLPSILKLVLHSLVLRKEIGIKCQTVKATKSPRHFSIWVKASQIFLITINLSLVLQWISGLSNQSFLASILRNIFCLN